MSKKINKVGYKQPPKSGRWKKGQSGNPSGKKKEPLSKPQQSLLECFAQQLKTPVEMITGGEKVSVPLGTAFAMKLLHEAMAAPIHHKLSALALFQKLGILSLHKVILETDPYEEDEGFMSQEDLRLLKVILESGEKYKDDDV
jgi:hypothetical protein